MKIKVKIKGISIVNLLLILASLVSCVAQEDTLNNLPEKFTTKIYKNGIKQFQLLLMNEKHLDKKQDNDLMNGRDIPVLTQQKAEAILIKRLEVKLKETQYCRNGYILSKEFSTLGLGELVIKGECVEGASSEDRRLFPNE